MDMTAVMYAMTSQGIPANYVNDVGQIGYSSTPTDSQKAAAQAIMTAFLANPAQWLASNQTPTQAWASGESYINSFFTTMQLMDMMMLLQTTTLPNQKAKLIAVETWIQTLKQAALTSPSTFNPSTFGNPPNTYTDIVTTTS